MPDRPEIERSFEAPPTSLHGRRRDPVPVIIAVAVVVFIAVAVVKPWRAGDPATSGIDSASATVAPVPSPLREGTESPTARATIGGDAASRGPDVDGRTAQYGAVPGNPVEAPAPFAAKSEAPTDGVIRTIAGALVGRSGDWGIGSGGPDGSSGAWVVWREASPVSEDRSIGIRPPPTCAGTPGGSVRIRPGIVVALTVPVGLVPDWKADAVRFDGRGRTIVDGPARQVTPPGNRGIAYLVRRDGSAWPTGAYRFRITTSTRSLSFDACLAGP